MSTDDQDGSEVPAHTIDRTDEYNKFIEDLKEYHEKRGTVLEVEPKVGPVPVDLLKVFKHIVANGGYDKVSEEKLAWRRMASELGIYSRNESTAGFYLKEKFYKNLAAYEISTVHKQEPPPKSILEDVSARGAGLLTRTVENFRKRENMAGAASSNGGGGGGGGSGESPAPPSGASTPAREKPAAGAGTPPTAPSSVRASRGLREQPPQRVIFQPETGPYRARPSSSQHQHHHHHHQNGPSSKSTHLLPNGHAAANGAHGTAHQPWRALTGASSGHVAQDTTARLAPRHPTTFPLRPVDTPATNPNEFLRRRQLIRPPPDPVRMVLAKHFEGPNIYSRCMMALRCGITEEESYALYHLVRISFEQGHRFRFESFPGLADALMERVVEVGALFYHVKWRVSWLSEEEEDELDGYPVDDVLNGSEGTPDILDRIAALEPRALSETIQPEAFSAGVALVTEAALVLRNLMLLPDNAVLMADAPLLRDVLCIMLNLPAHESVVELKNYALDMAEALTPYLALGPADPLYKTLVGQLLLSQDRGVILTALHALARISVNLDTIPNTLEAVPAPVLRRLTEWMLLNDDDMLDACLDFLYQYTAVVANVDHLVRSVVSEHLVTHLVRLLSHGARKTYRDVVLVPERVPEGGGPGLAPGPSVPAAAPALATATREIINELPPDLMDELVDMDEAGRVQQWIRSLFEEDDSASVTQLSVWQTYQATFSAVLKAHGKPQIQPARFIQTSVGVYDGSQAQVTKPDESGSQKFIIRGIRPRLTPVSTSGREYQRCLWSTDANSRHAKCGRFFLDPEPLWRHILEDHLGEPRSPDGGYSNAEKPLQCTWALCAKYHVPTTLPLATFSRHLMVHTSLLWPQPSTGSTTTTTATTPPSSSLPAPTSTTSSEPPSATTKPPRTSRLTSPARTFRLPGEETPTLRDERNPSLPPQACGVPLSAALVLRNIARNVRKTDAEEELLKGGGRGRGGRKGGGGSGGGGGGGWNERLFRLVLPRLHEVHAQNKALAPYIASLFDLIYQDPELEAAVCSLTLDDD